jgi:DNA ligase (NAD+)
MGFRAAPESRVCESFEDVQAFWKGLQKKREKLGFWIDGMVARVNDNEVYEALGVVGKTPRGLVAWKFPAEESTTVVKDIQWFVGRTGALTPVAVVNPTFIAGTTVQHASLHNLDEIGRLDVRVGDTVILYKAGDIIPKVKRVLKELRPKGAKAVEAPKKCPVCGGGVKRPEGEVATYCANPECPAKHQEAVLFAARAFDIEGLGPQTIVSLMERGLVKRGSDLFALKPEDLLELEGFAEISSKKLVHQIQARKRVGLARFITGLGMRNVGEQTALDLAGQFRTLDAFLAATKDDLMGIEGIGEVVADSIVEYLSRKENRALIKSYLDRGVVVAKAEAPAKGPLTGKSVVVTGTLQTMSREEAEGKVRLNGGKAASSVSKKTSFVLVGENPGSKADKARELGVKTLSEKEFLSMIGKN